MKSYNSVFRGVNYDLFLSKEASEELENALKKEEEVIRKNYENNPGVTLMIYGSLEQELKTSRKSILNNTTSNLIAQLFINSSIKKLKKLLKKGDKAAMLNAHGATINNEWCYLDKDYKKINSWVKKQEGKDYKALLITCCNPDNKKPIMTGTPIIYSKGDTGLMCSHKTGIIK